MDITKSELDNLVHKYEGFSNNELFNALVILHKNIGWNELTKRLKEEVKTILNHRFESLNDEMREFLSHNI